MDTNEKYLKHLASALRWRRVEEDRLLDALREVQMAAVESGRPAEEEFGPAREYAETFDTGRAWYLGYVIGSVLGVAVLIALSFIMFERIRSGESTLLTTLGITAGAFALTLLAMFLGQVIDRRLPSGLARR